MDAVGLRMADLFEHPRDTHLSPLQKRNRWDARAMLKTLLHEADVILIAANQMAEGQPLDAVDRKRVLDAHDRIAAMTGIVL
jgi:hypothetical protein